MNVGGRFEAFMTVPAGVSLSADTGGGATAVSITAGTYTTSLLCAHVQARLIAVMTGAWTVTSSVGRSGSGLTTIALGVGGTFSITWTSTVLRDVLGFIADISTATSATGTRQAVGLWFPDCPPNLAGDPARAPEVTDTTSTRGPRGKVIGYSSNLLYQHKMLTYSYVQQSRVFEGVASPAGSSWQQWLRDTQWGQGHAWFVPCSPFQVYWENAGVESIVGADLNSGAGPTNGWCFDPPLANHDHIENAAAPWLGLWKLSLGNIVSEG